ncbi:MAG: phosphoribosylformylglycinamidine synthase II, partial [Elusimicrobia bacterium RIFOXYB2_FULL_62_6]
CLSVFKDNAGIVEFGRDKKWGLAFKAETHNHPCAVEPYGGAETGVGGVIRDILGVGLGAKPVLNTDNFCFGRLDSKTKLPPHALSPERVFRGVVEGVRDYGNRMGIPTAAGGIYFDDGYLLNPLVYVGCAGLIPVDKIDKRVRPGDLIVSIGGRTGRDGIHGATFSSANIDEETGSSAVQIGHALNEKKTLDVLMRARDLGLYGAVTDCGAGGFSSAIGELGAETGAHVRLENAKLKDTRIEPWEIWVSESQERMILAVPPAKMRDLEDILNAESCEYCVLGEFTSDARLLVTFNNETVADLGMDFLHGGVPSHEKEASFARPAAGRALPRKKAKPHLETLKELLAHPNICSRHSVITQYDHEVQGGTAGKPLQGRYGDGPGDAAVIWPHSVTGNLNDFAGFAAAHGFNPAVGRIDPYQMALYSVDEAVRNLLCAGAEISRTAILDNFCAASPADPRVMGALVLAAEGCHDAAMAYGAPFISGKDSFYNQSKDARGREYPIPLSLLISAVAPVEDVRKALTINFKEAGNPVYLAGISRKGLGGSVYAEIAGGDEVVNPVNMKEAVRLYTAVLKAMKRGFVLAAHDVSQGGLAVTLSEMAFSSEFGAELDLDGAPAEKGVSAAELLFGESPSRLVLEVAKGKEGEFLKLVKGLPVREFGFVSEEPVLRIKAGADTLLRENTAALKERWRRELL